jgi:hypothetical protein
MDAISRCGQFCGSLLLNAALALFGAGTLETALEKVVHAHSVHAVLWRASGLSLGCALILGASIYRHFRTTAAKWVWAVATTWTLARLLLFLGSGHNLGYAWGQLSGAVCLGSQARASCIANFVLFTIPFIRGIGYSAGASLAAIVPMKRSTRDT